MLNINKHPIPKVKLLEIPADKYDTECIRQYEICVDYIDGKLQEARRNNEHKITIRKTDLTSLCHPPKNGFSCMIFNEGTEDLLKNEYTKAGYKWICRSGEDASITDPIYFVIEF